MLTKVYGISAKESNSMKSSNPYSGVYEAETARCLNQNGGNPVCNQGGMIIAEEDVECRVRRLTPKECALLQGFPDTWCDDLHDDDYEFWKKTLDEYCEINGKKLKSEKQIRKFMENPYSEAAEYKMWGNGVALPCVWFIMEGIKWYEESQHR